jgi:hypothetical protein
MLACTSIISALQIRNKFLHLSLNCDQNKNKLFGFQVLEALCSLQVQRYILVQMHMVTKEPYVFSSVYYFFISLSVSQDIYHAKRLLFYCYYSYSQGFSYS